jgi:hypothetical protein
MRTQTNAGFDNPHPVPAVNVDCDSFLDRALGELSNVMVGTHTVAKARRAREVFRFIRINSPAYLRVFHSDLRAFREEFVRTLGGLMVGAVAGLLFVSFLSVALLVSAWETKLRLATAWAVSGGWLIIALAGLTYARRALRAPVPFASFARLLQRDLEAIERAEP